MSNEFDLEDALSGAYLVRKYKGDGRSLYKIKSVDLKGRVPVFTLKCESLHDDFGSVVTANLNELREYFAMASSQRYNITLPVPVVALGIYDKVWYYDIVTKKIESVSGKEDSILFLIHKTSTSFTVTPYTLSHAIKDGIVYASKKDAEKFVEMVKI